MRQCRLRSRACGIWCARDLADLRYTEPLTVEDLAKVEHMSRAHFSREYKKAFGESPYSYLLTRRLERAATLLRSTDWSVADICITPTGWLKAQRSPEPLDRAAKVSTSADVVGAHVAASVDLRQKSPSSLVVRRIRHGRSRNTSASADVNHGNRDLHSAVTCGPD